MHAWNGTHMPNVYIKMVWISCEFLIISLTFQEFGTKFWYEFNEEFHSQDRIENNSSFTQQTNTIVPVWIGALMTVLGTFFCWNFIGWLRSLKAHRFLSVHAIWIDENRLAESKFHLSEETPVGMAKNVDSFEYN